VPLDKNFAAVMQLLRSSACALINQPHFNNNDAKNVGIAELQRMSS